MVYFIIGGFFRLDLPLPESPEDELVVEEHNKGHADSTEGEEYEVVPKNALVGENPHQFLIIFKDKGIRLTLRNACASSPSSTRPSPCSALTSRSSTGIA